MFCSRCGAGAPSNARFCPGCGGPLTAPTLVDANASESMTRPSTDPQRPSSSSGWLTASDSIDHGRFEPGAILDGRYRVIGLVGRGGMGEVYRADDLRLGQQVALKFLPESVGRDPVRLAQFHNEVRIARQVSHANICRVYDIGEAEGRLYLSMEYVDGEDLASLLRRIGRFPEDKGIEIARQLCLGLAAAHDRGVLHRDLKPANVMLDGAGKVRLMDFGLAAVEEVKDVRAGTPAYMAPEQLFGREVTPRSDIYSLGLLLYELFTGRRAFTAATLAELVTQHQDGRLPRPSEALPAIDPAIDRAIVRCLDPDPSRRPSSALAVAAALPGGDPLAAAIAAGETPSPEMVAAAGEGEGLSVRAALPVLVAVVAGLALSYVLALRTSPLQALRPELTPEVLAQKARDAIRQIGYTERPQDEAYGFEWEGRLIDHLREEVTTRAQWDQALSRGPSPLLFWYRASERAMTATEFHDDLLTPGIVTPDDPPPVESGMVALKLDHQGRLAYFEVIPRQRHEGRVDARPVEWGPLLALAGLDVRTLQQTDARWTWLATSDTRAAWTGSFPGSSTPLRVEAAALAGRPVAFMTIGPWTQPWREAPGSTTRETALVFILFSLVIAILAGGTLLARKNLREGRGDRHGAVALASITASGLLALWICRVHIAASTGLFAMFLLAVATAVFYGVLLWTIYLALEPFVRRHWPQTLVSWTTFLGWRVRDAVVGRDVLVGVALGVLIALLVQVGEPLSGNRIIWPSIDLMLNTRSSAAELLERAMYGMRAALLFLFMLVLLRALFRRQWVAAVVFVLLFSSINMLNSDQPALDGLRSALNFTLMAAALLRWGLTSLAVGAFVADLLLVVPATTQLSAWYAGQSALAMAIPLALAAWGVYVSMGRRS